MAKTRTASEAEVSEIESGENYGSVDLNLSPDWRRDDQELTAISSAIVGHSDGVAEAHITKDPSAKHQFSWVGTGDEVGLTMRRRQGYALVTSDAWTKGEGLWEWRKEKDDKDGPEFCWNYGDRLMARSEARYIADAARRSVGQDLNKVVEGGLATGSGGEVGRDLDGNPLRPMARR